MRIKYPRKPNKKETIARIIEKYFCEPPEIRAARHLIMIGMKSDQLAGPGWSEVLDDVARIKTLNTMRDYEKNI